MKHTMMTLLVVLGMFLLTTPVANAQPEPPGGWLNYQVNQVRAIVPGILYGHGYGYGYGGGLLGGLFGGYGGYGWGDYAKSLMVDSVANAGVSVVDILSNRSQTGRAMDLDEKRMMLEYGLDPAQLKLLREKTEREERRAAEHKKSATSTSSTSSTTTMVIQDPTDGGTQRKSVINATGFAISIIEANGKEHLVAKGQSALLAEFTGMRISVISGEKTKGIHFYPSDDGRTGVLTNGEWEGR